MRGGAVIDPILLPLGFLLLVLAFFLGRRVAYPPRTHIERLEYNHAMAGHGLACLLMLGFLGAVFLPLLGVVDMADQTVSNMVFYIVGAVQGPLGRMLGNYAKQQDEPKDSPPAGGPKP